MSIPNILWKIVSYPFIGPAAQEFEDRPALDSYLRRNLDIAKDNAAASFNCDLSALFYCTLFFEFTRRYISHETRKSTYAVIVIGLSYSIVNIAAIFAWFLRKHPHPKDDFVTTYKFARVVFQCNCFIGVTSFIAYLLYPPMPRLLTFAASSFTTAKMSWDISEDLKKQANAAYKATHNPLCEI